MKLLLLLLITSSCALKQHTIEKEEMVPYPEYIQQTNLNGSTKAIFVSEVIDQRMQKNDLGFLDTGVKRTPTPIVLNDDLSFHVSEVFKRELKRRGAFVSEHMEQYDLKIVIQELLITHLYDGMLDQAKCQFKYSYALNSNNTKNSNISGNVETVFTSPGDSGGARRKVPRAIETCLINGVNKLVSDQKFQKAILY